MKKQTIKMITLSLLITILMIAGCTQEEIAEQERVISVNATTVQLSNQIISRTFTGSLEGERQADIYAKIAEAVEKVHIEEGARVKAGQTLISLDKTGPSSMYRSAESMFRNSEKNFKKMEFLYKEGAIAESKYDAARTDYEVNQANFDAAKKLVQVSSPINGVVTSIGVSAGDYVYLGQKLATVASVEQLRVKLGVNAKEIAHFTKGDIVRVFVDAINAEGTGKVVAVSGSADPATRAFEVEVLMPNVVGFHPGMFVRVEVTLSELNDIVAIPRNAVITLGGTPSVFLVSGNKAVKRELVLGIDLGGDVVVTSGLNIGDTLVTLGQTYLDDGFAVRVIEFNGEKAGQ